MTDRYLAKSVLTVAVVVGVVVALGGSLQAAPAIYEPFDYPAGGLNGKSGSSEVGLTGTWGANAETLVVPGSLTWGGLATTGGSIGNLTYYVNRYGGTRAVSASALAGNGLLNDGATLWFGLEMGYGRDAAGTAANLSNARLGFALANSQFNGGNYDYWIVNEGEQLGSGLGVVLGRISNVNGRVVAAQFRDLASGDGVAGNVLGSWTGTGTTLKNDEHGLFVGKIVWGEASDSIEIYQLGTDLSLPASPISTLTVSVNQSTYDTITFARGDPMTMDEIRFGRTFEDVIGNPPPPPVLALRVDTITGATTLLGDAYQAVGINFYQITSAAHSLDAVNWSSLADQDFEGGGPPNGTGNGWEEAGGVGKQALAEAFLMGNSAIGVSQLVGLGEGYDAFVGAKDLVFTYRTDAGEIIEGLVEYVTSVIAGDANWDGIVDAADYITLKRNFGMATGARYKDGDFDGDHDVDWNDLQTLMGNFGARGVGSAPAAPEPATLGLLALGGLALIRRRPRPWEWPSYRQAARTETEN